MGSSILVVKVSGAPAASSIASLSHTEMRVTSVHSRSQKVHEGHHSINQPICMFQLFQFLQTGVYNGPPINPQSWHRAYS